MKILITAGPTREYIDPVRFISNASSGRMGYALAQVAKENNAKVIIVSGPTSLTPPSGVKVKYVTSCREMLFWTKKYASSADVIIGAAAITDWRPVHFSREKLKRCTHKLQLTFRPNPDILLEVAKVISSKTILVGFALESKNLIREAQKKLKEKNLDIIVANTPESIGSEFTECVIITKKGKIKRVMHCNKYAAAKLIWSEIFSFAKTIENTHH